MNLLRHRPTRPYRNLWLAVLLGVPLAVLLVSLGLVLRVPSASRLLTMLAELLPGILLGYVLALPIALVFGLPVLWVAQRVRLAGPAVAFAAAATPGGVLWVLAQGRSPIAWLPLAIAATIGAVFVQLAYRRA